jgi:hypothetical protein
MASFYNELQDFTTPVRKPKPVTVQSPTGDQSTVVSPPTTTSVPAGTQLAPPQTAAPAPTAAVKPATPAPAPLQPSSSVPAPAPAQPAPTATVRPSIAPPALLDPPQGAAPLSNVQVGGTRTEPVYSAKPAASTSPLLSQFQQLINADGRVDPGEREGVASQLLGKGGSALGSTSLDVLQWLDANDDSWDPLTWEDSQRLTTGNPALRGAGGVATDVGNDGSIDIAAGNLDNMVPTLESIGIKPEAIESAVLKAAKGSGVGGAPAVSAPAAGAAAPAGRDIASVLAMLKDTMGANVGASQQRFNDEFAPTAITGNEVPTGVMPSRSSGLQSLLDKIGAAGDADMNVQRSDELSSLIAQMRGDVERQMKAPTAYDDELFAGLFDQGMAKINEGFTEQEHSLANNLARRGISYGRGAAGEFDKLASKKATARNDLMLPLMRERALSIADGRRAASSALNNLAGFVQGDEQFRTQRRDAGFGKLTTAADMLGTLEASERGERRVERGYVDDLRRTARQDSIDEFLMGENLARQDELDFNNVLMQALGFSDTSNAANILAGAGGMFGNAAGAYNDQAEGAGDDLAEIASLIAQFYGPGKKAA